MRLDPALTFVAIQPIMRKVSIDAIKKSPRSYGKFVMVNFMFFFNNQRGLQWIIMNKWRMSTQGL
ncbi:MAG: hypothetical protein R3A12_19310 [Ignavibacteria bacterium]